MQHDVSIIIPTYVTNEKGLEWLGECLESAKMQDSDIIVVDDGSTQEISKLVRRFGIDYHRIVHAGVSAARNQGVLRATRSLIIPLDCDDRFAEGAIKKLLGAWNGSIPVYSDVRKFGLENVDHYTLLDFDCEHIYTHVGFASVNVLHSKAQWKSIGGWNENLDFYEDGEYNARLFAQYCGLRFPEPLVEYRIHENQRTKQYKSKSAYYAKKILSSIRSLDMGKGCCSKGKRTHHIVPVTPLQINMKSTPNIRMLPGEEEGRMLAQYVGGKGKGKHYYRGARTNFPYKVTYGDFVNVDPSDINIGVNDNSAFVKVKSAESQTMEMIVEATPQPVTDEHARFAREYIAKVPMIDLPDIANMSVREIKGIDDLTQETVNTLLSRERSGKNRSKVVEFLEKLL